MPKIGPGCFRLILALLVVLHHSTPLHLGTWAVGLFFCLSGFWIAEMWSSKYRRLDRPYLEFLLSRWWRLAPVFLFTTLIAAWAMHRHIVIGDDSVLSKPLWWCTQPLIAGSAIFGRLLRPTWTLDLEMRFYLAAPLLVFALARVPLRLRLMLLAVALLWCWLQNGWGDATESPRLDIWVGIFLIGMIASVSGWRATPRIALVAALLLVAGFAASAILPMTRGWIFLRANSGRPVTGFLVASLTVGAMALAAPIAIWTTQNPSGRFDRFLGDVSYPLYLFHPLPQMWFYQLANGGGHSGHRIQVVALALNVIVSLAGAIAILIVVDRPIQRLRAGWIKRHAHRQPTRPVRWADPIEPTPAPAIELSGGAA